MKNQKLTKFSDIMYYYKWHIIITIITIAAVVFFATECRNKVEDDLVITAILSNYAMSTAPDAITSDMVEKGIIPDFNGDGVSKAYMNLITFPVNPQNQEEMMAAQQVSIAFAADDSILFLLDKDLLEMYENDELFGDISRVAELHGLGEEDLYISEDGTVLGISLKGNPYLEEKGIPTDTLYACYRMVYPERITDETKAKIQVADDMLGYIMK